MRLRPRRSGVRSDSPVSASKLESPTLHHRLHVDLLGCSADRGALAAPGVPAARRHSADLADLLGDQVDRVGPRRTSRVDRVDRRRTSRVAPVDPVDQVVSVVRRLRRASTDVGRTITTGGHRGTRVTTTGTDAGMERHGVTGPRRGVGAHHPHRRGWDRRRRRLGRLRHQSTTGVSRSSQSGIPASASGVSTSSGCGSHFPSDRV